MSSPVEIGPDARPAPPAVMVIFGAAGDLAKRKLLPALHNLRAAGLLPDSFAVLGTATRTFSDEAFVDLVAADVREHLGSHFREDVWSWLAERVFYEGGDLRDRGLYERLAGRLNAIAEKRGTAGSALFYLATPPSFFLDAVRSLGEQGLLAETQGRFRRVIVEKPFGHDLDSARALNRAMQASLDERQIYRIDHYLGKETVQNILVFRFANGIFEPIWNRRYVDHVQITVSEELGVGHRGRYYEESGALRDMVPNHLFQVLGYVAMEPPTSFEANAVRDEKGKVFRAIPPIAPEEVLTRVVRGQYGSALLPGGASATAYRAEPHVPPDSRVETFVAMKLTLDSWRWAGVPFYLRTGKRMPRRLSEVVVQFKHVPTMMFHGTSVEKLRPNRLTLRLQPREGIALSFGAKVPGPTVRLGGVDMDFCYAEHFGDTPSTGYETLLYDAMNGDATLFQRADSVEMAWSVVQPVLDVWSALPPRDFPNYDAGTWGPKDADALLARDGRAWSSAP